jgi:hypothetical protein
MRFGRLDIQRSCRRDRTAEVAMLVAVTPEVAGAFRVVAAAVARRERGQYP